VADEWGGLLHQIRKEELKNWVRSVAINHTLIVLRLKPSLHIADPVYKRFSNGINFIISAGIRKSLQTLDMGWKGSLLSRQVTTLSLHPDIYTD
jgi:hypothetical protein